ncbi:hypothetical protein BD413DRAFT_289180 [Trametes elegans]|nr:hypothetical protein BD413DRAFT_289180 [Trametes elegans]
MHVWARVRILGNVVENYKACTAAAPPQTTTTLSLSTSNMPQTRLPGYATKVPELSPPSRDKPEYLPTWGRGVTNPVEVSPRNTKQTRKPQTKTKATTSMPKAKGRRGTNAAPPRARHPKARGISRSTFSSRRQDSLSPCAEGRCFPNDHTGPRTLRHLSCTCFLARC